MIDDFIIFFSTCIVIVICMIPLYEIISYGALNTLVGCVCAAIILVAMTIIAAIIFIANWFDMFH